MNLILDLSKQFAFDIINYVKALTDQKYYVIANQLLKAGTSIGANANEAQAAESKADFKHKMRIAFKEAKETRYWLTLCKNSPDYPDPGKLIHDIESIIRVLGKIISTSGKLI